MTHRLNKVQANKKGRSKNEEITRRSIFSSKDPANVSAEREKARMQCARRGPEDSREFTSYFYGHKNNIDPFYVVTSHAATSGSIKKPLNNIVKKQVIPAYPSLVPGLLWSPSIESYSEEGQDEQEFICRRCKNCKETYTSERRWLFKDNIVRFCDSSTMTPNVNDAACGLQRPCLEDCASISICTSDVAVRDEPEQQVRFTPTPILKKFDVDADFNFQYYEQSPVEISELDDAALEDQIVIESCPKSRRAKLPTCPSLNGISSQCDEPRKNIYNEGISDVIANNFPDYCSFGHRVQVSGTGKRNYSRTSVFSKNFEIPFAHRNRSKYHHECKTGVIRNPYHYGIEEEVRQAAKPRALRCCQPGGLERSELMPCVKMPKKVLSSERDIDSYIKSQSRRPKFF